MTAVTVSPLRRFAQFVQTSAFWHLLVAVTFVAAIGQNIWTGYKMTRPFYKLEAAYLHEFGQVMAAVDTVADHQDPVAQLRALGTALEIMTRTGLDGKAPWLEDLGNNQDYGRPHTAVLRFYENLRNGHNQLAESLRQGGVFGAGTRLVHDEIRRDANGWRTDSGIRPDWWAGARADYEWKMALGTESDDVAEGFRRWFLWVPMCGLAWFLGHFLVSILFDRLHRRAVMRGFGRS